MTEQKQRFLYIDLLRGWAVLVMVEVHVVNAFLQPELRTTDWFKVLNFVNGLVAPSFLFISGFSFMLIAQRKWNDYLNRTPVFRKQLGRIFQVLLVGYLLHLPFFSLSRLLNSNWQEWSVFWKVDVLHTIAISLLTLVVLIIILKNQTKNFFAILILSFVVIFSAPFVYDRNIDHLFPEPISNYFTAAHSSQFPLVPWMGFVLCGGLASQVLVWWKEKVDEQKIFPKFFFLGMFTIVVSLIANALPISIYGEYNVWRSSPAFFFTRLGIVMVLLSSLWYWEKNFQSQKSLVSIVGAESLLAYAGHLLVIYGQFFNGKSLTDLIGTTQPIPEVLMMTVVLMTITVAASYVWHRIKNWSMFYARVLMYSILIVVLFIFLINPM